jgi:hypothetical protein
VPSAFHEEWCVGCRLGPTRFQVIEVFRQAEQKDARLAQVGIPLVRFTTDFCAAADKCAIELHRRAKCLRKLPFLGLF